MLIGVFGTGRNGSSLLGRLLDGMENTYVHPIEERFLTAFSDIASIGTVTRATNQNCRTKKPRNLARSVDGRLLGEYFGASVDAIFSEFLQKCELTRELPTVSFRQLIADGQWTIGEFLVQYLRGLGAHVRPDIAFEHYLFKSVETPYIEEYGRLFPEMKFIHIIRDPVAVCSSQKRSLMENKNLPACYLGHDWLTCMLEKRWLPHVRSILKCGTDQRHVATRYEDLVTDPTGEIERICRHLGLASPPRCDTQTIFYDAMMQDWGFNPSKKGVVMPATVVADLQVKHGYEEILTPREIALINFKTASYLQDRGYQTPAVPRRSHLVLSHILPDRWDFMHCKTVGSKCRAALGMLYRRIGLFTF